jgi:hypothetical protein
MEQTDNKEGPEPRPSLSEKQRRELWLYIGVSIAAVELLVAVGAMFYGFMGSSAERVFAFPWLTWGAISALAPALLLLLVHSADVGLFRAPAGAASEKEWQMLLPQRMQKLYRIIKGAPVVAVLVGIVALAGALLTLEGALSALKEVGQALRPHVPFIVGGIAALASVIVVAVAWLNFRTRRLIAEYEFRREVLEKTGVIIVDKGSTPLPPGGVGDVPYALVAGEEDARIKALPAAQQDEHSPGAD